MMKHISILIPQGHTSLVNIVVANQIFNQVNEFLHVGQKIHEDQTVKEVQEYIETHFQEKINVDDVPKHFVLSR